MSKSRTINILLWILQVLLAALFAFSGVMKFLMPVEQLTANSSFSAGFLYFIAVAEILGALGLILPGLTRIQTKLTPLAAAGLLIIMIGAVITTLKMGLAVALIPLITGILVGLVAYGRWRVAPL